MESIIKKSIILVLVAAIFACEVDSNCGSVNVDFVTFSTVTLNANSEEQAVGVIFDSIVSPQARELFFEEDTLNTFELPLSPVDNKTDFYFYYGPRTDTISFTYEKRNRVESPECGFDIEYLGLDTVTQTFDSLVIVNDTLKRTVNAPNIKLFIL